MSFESLPPEIILEIAKHLTSDKDFVSFTLTDRRTFLLFSSEDAIWREKLDDDDQLAADVLELEEDHQPPSCPAKEIFFRRPKSERNWRKNNFRIVDYCPLPNKEFRNYFNNVEHQDFFLRLQVVDSLNSWHISWVDPCEGSRIRNGSLKRPDSAVNCTVCTVFAASRKILIVMGKEGRRLSEGEKDAYEFLVAIDLTRADELRIMWETRRQTDSMG